MIEQETRILAAEFLAMPESMLRVELINGMIVYGESPMSPAPHPDHQHSAAALFRLVDASISDGELLFAPVDILLDEHTVLQPDVMWIAPDSRCVFRDGRYRDAAPDLVIEILSPATARYDKTVKFDLYERHGTQEYWIADPINRYLEVWTAVDGRFMRHGVFGETDTFESPLLKTTIRLSGIFP